MDIAAGGAHSACVTSAGELYTWGKGRYGRLGHGDSEDQTRPKLVCMITASCAVSWYSMQCFTFEKPRRVINHSLKCEIIRGSDLYFFFYPTGGVLCYPHGGATV